jgi:hypothetical protein
MRCVGLRDGARQGVVRDEWYRSPAWGSADQRLFDEKLSRARSSRAQYLRIRGLTLVQTADARRGGTPA